MVSALSNCFLHLCNFNFVITLKAFYLYGIEVKSFKNLISMHRYKLVISFYLYDIPMISLCIHNSSCKLTDEAPGLTIN